LRKKIEGGIEARVKKEIVKRPYLSRERNGKKQKFDTEGRA